MADNAVMSSFPFLQAYAGKMGIDASAYELKYDGENVSLTDTPDTLGMEEGESVDVLLKQVRFGGLAQQFSAP